MTGPKRFALRYGSALALSALALSARLLAYPYIGVQAPFVTFYVAIVGASLLLGLGPSILVTVIGALCATYFFFEPLHSFAIWNPAEALWLMFYFLVSGSIIAALEALRRAKASSDGNALLAHERLQQLQHEVAERKRAQQAEAEQRQWYQTTLNSIGDAVLATDREGRIVFLNRVAETLTGWSSEEAAGKRTDEVFVIQNEETGQRAEIPVDRVLREGRVAGLANHTVLLSRTGVLTPIDDSAAPICGPGGELIGVVMVFKDISSRRASERALARSAADMEQFAYLASHDLQSPLRTVSNFAQVLERRYGTSLDPNAAEYIRFIVDGTRRMQRLVSDLLEYCRAGASAISVEAVPVEHVLQDVIEALYEQIHSAGACITHDQLPVIWADRVKITQVLQNLISNAIRFRSERRCEIHVSAEQINTSWCFSVRDNGVGFDGKYAEQIFGMFQRLCPAKDSAGSGIGLAIAKRIVEGHHGRIWAESAEGCGATFKFTIPISAMESASEAAS